MKTILVPVDLSAATNQVCDAACALAKLLHARVVLLNVVPMPPIMLNDIYSYNAGAMVQAISMGEKQAARRLHTLGRRCTQKRVKARAIQVTGDAVSEILAQMSSLRAEYLVLGSHGHGVAYDLLVGSTTQGVLRKATCPVLVVPMPR